MMRCGVAGLFAALVAAAPLAAETPSMAIGRITYGVHVPGAAICTGTLVAPGLVLTAAHCVSRTADPATLRFDAGLGHGSPATFRGRGIIMANGAAEGVDRDVALIELDSAATSISPMPVGSPETRRLTLVGYRRDAPDQPVRDDLCLIKADVPPRLWLGCPVVSGLSGAPLLERHAAGWRVVAVMVAAGKGQHRSLAIRLPDDIVAHIAAR